MKALPWITCVLLVGALLWMWMYEENKIPRTAYVELKDLYNDFKMTKELEANLSNVGQKRKLILDSMAMRINALTKGMEGMSAKASSQERDQILKERQQYYLKQQQFETDNRDAADQYSQQIWKQINQYLKDYGKEKGYTYIFGADGSGSLMYGKEMNNITAELKQYLNTRYKGNK